MLRTTVTPGASIGTSTIECCAWRGPSGSERPSTSATLQRSSAAPVMNHLRASMTNSSPSRRIAPEMFVASQEATAGSVIAKHERISPSSSGTSHRSCCSGVPNIASTSMLPVSGAPQLSASGAMCGLRPVTSARCAYSRLLSPAPQRSSGRNRFHSPRLRASALSSSTTGGSLCGSPPSSIWRS